MKPYLLFIFLFVFATPLLQAQCPINDNPGVHTVQKGETLYRIASHYNITVSRLLDWNLMKVGDPLRVCQDLYVAAYAVPARSNNELENERKIPDEFNGRSVLDRILHKEKNVATSVPDDPATTALTTAPTTPTTYAYTTPTTKAFKKQGGNRHIVKAGETVAGLADLYGYTEKRFRELNALTARQEVAPGWNLLSSDCACDRINYDDPDKFGFEEEGDIRPTDFDSNTNTARINPDYVPQPSDRNIATQPAKQSDRTVMSNVELTMVDEINLMRTNPSAYVRHVRAYVADQKANNGFPIDDNVVNELIRELQQSPVLSNLQPLACVYDAAQKHGQDLLSMGRTDHQGSDGLWPWDRVRKACPQLTEGNENLVGGPDSVREAVIILLIDEGIPSRGHRRTLMKPEWEYVACYKIGKVGQMPNCWVQKFGF